MQYSLVVATIPGATLLGGKANTGAIVPPVAITAHNATEPTFLDFFSHLIKHNYLGGTLG